MDEAKSLIKALQAAKKTLVTAESCTGGLLGKLLTDVPGASSVYLGGVITYAYTLKEELLGVDHTLLENKGAVCEEVVIAMARGAREHLNADIAISVTGNAGPGTDAKNPNVGEIYIACADQTDCICKKLQLTGNREENRTLACEEALKITIEITKEGGFR